jgi:hypothetical protein
LKKLHILRPFEAATLRIEDWGDIYYDLTVDNGALTFSSIIDSNVVVLKSGRVGIGTASPEEMLHIDKSSGSLGLRVSSDAASYQYMNFGAKNGYSMGRTYDDKFFVNRDEPLGSGISRLLTVKSDGSVGIGTTDPLKKLHIYNPHYATGTSLRIENYGDVSYDITADDGALSFSSHTHDNVLVLKSGGNVGIGTTNPAAKLDVVGKIRISNSAGDPLVEMGEGLDYAEGFDVSEKSKVASGTVLIIDVENPGKLAVSNKAYDSKVAGIVAGANGIGSGVRLGTDEFDCDVALAGRVYCNVDATETAVEPGDLLTTSSMAGYAMKVTDYMRAQGAILGKAMEKLEKGKKGQILVLVTLQ